MPQDQPNQHLTLTSTEAAAIATALNGQSMPDAYGSSWTDTSVLAAHANSDPNQRRRLIYLMYLYSQAVG